MHDADNQNQIVVIQLAEFFHGRLEQSRGFPGTERRPDAPSMAAVNGCPLVIWIGRMG